MATNQTTNMLNGGINNGHAYGKHVIQVLQAIFQVSVWQLFLYLAIFWTFIQWILAHQKRVNLAKNTAQRLYADPSL